MPVDPEKLKAKAKATATSKTESSRRPVPGSRRWPEDYMKDSPEPPLRRIIIQFKKQQRPGAYRTFTSFRDGLTIRPLFERFTRKQLRTLRKRSLRGLREARVEYPFRKLPHLDSFYAITAPEDSDELGRAREKVATWSDLRNHYLEQLPKSPPSVDASLDDPYAHKQAYLGEAPVGINVQYAWNQDLAGADGAGTHLVDIEQGWRLGHDDLTGADIRRIYGGTFEQYEQYHWHGTQVLGVIAAQDNGSGTVGIAPAARVTLVSQRQAQGYYNTANAVMIAASVLDPGDVILLEAQTAAFEPVDSEWAVRAAIRVATGLGITVIAAAGNGGKELTGGDHADSGAVIVGASATDRERLAVDSFPAAMQNSTTPSSNYGERVHCFAQGQDVVTCDVDEDGTHFHYTDDFKGTSSAAAIVAGVALVVQGVARERLGAPLEPGQIRELFLNHGTESGDPDDDRIGLMPDLGTILKSDTMNTVPDDKKTDPDDPDPGAPDDGDEPCGERERVVEVSIYESCQGASYDIKVQKRGWIHPGNKDIVADLMCCMTSKLTLLAADSAENGGAPPSGGNNTETKNLPPPSSGGGEPDGDGRPDGRRRC